MKTFNCYIAKSLLLNLGMALGILVFVMLGTHFFRAFDLLARGVSPLFLGRMLLFLLPDVLRFALPLSLLVSCVLVFSRMSADNEVIALQASGVSLWQIISPCLFISVIISLACLYLSMFAAPDCRYQARQMQLEALLGNPLTMLEPGMELRLTDHSVLHIGHKRANVIYDLHLFDRDPDSGRLRDISAAKGLLMPQPKNGKLELLLQGFSFAEYELGQSQEHGDSLPFVQADSLSLPLDFAQAQEQKPLSRRLKMMNVKMLFGDWSRSEADGESASRHLLEFHYRLVLSMSPFAFLILGVPFGIRNKRSEASIGLLLCVVMALIFYAFLLLSDSLREYPRLHPELILWIPNLAYQIGGLLVIRKMGRNA
ncbi:MAG: LptF/LptG family permease [Lentisphaeria bacterium]|nr:LptF/LptG family permease [Lentisphaeria bacterium]MDY0175785.1 LptF/LptG family permease [Lentisphaeria bacterium]NLZ60125.1 YjgP/YjgQ family permease [Lentisphaerota bacterium]